MPYAKEIKTRLTWLLLGLCLSLGIAQVIRSFESTLEKNLILASFIPLVVYMSDAVGTQMEAIIIRQLSKKVNFSFRGFLKRQLVIVLSVGLVIGTVAAIATTLITGSQDIGMVIGVSLFCGILSSPLTGALIPYLFWRLHDDPAEASGPIATVVQNLFSVLIFFLVAEALL